MLLFMASYRGNLERIRYHVRLFYRSGFNCWAQRYDDAEMIFSINHRGEES